MQLLVLAVVLSAVVATVHAASEVTIHGAGATLPLTILATGKADNPSWISSFEAITDNRVTVVYNGTGSDIGDRLLRAEHPIDFAISDAPLTDAEVASLKSPIVHLPITLTALQFVYNLPDDQISGPLNLTADIVARIYTRQITNWNDPTILQSNPHLRYAGPIIAVVRSDGSGSTYVVSQFLATGSAYWPHGAAQVINWPAGVSSGLLSAGVANKVSSTVGSIGYVSWAAADGMKSAMVKNSAGYWTHPTQESVLAACLDHSPDFGGFGLPGPGDSWESFSLVNEAGHSTYPLVTFSYALVYQNMVAMADRGAAVGNLLKYINMESTQAVAPNFHHVPLPLFVRQQNEKVIETLDLGLGYSFYDYYNPHVPKGGNRTAGILSLVMSLLIIGGLLGLIAKEIHAHFGQDRAHGVY
jgi:phosphate transport system substrate-binding protein